MINKKEKLICIFLITSIITLFLNDWIWKYEYTHVHFKIFDSGQKTKIHLINCTIQKGIHLQDWKKLKKETKRRKEHLEHFFTKRMK